MNSKQEIAFFRSKLKQLSNPKRAIGAKAYLKSPWKFYGVNTPTKRNMVRSWFKEHPNISIDEVAVLAGNLWNSHWHEEKTLSIMLLQYRSKQLKKKHLPLLEHMINEATGWDHLDEIAVHLVGQLIDNDRSTLNMLLKWAKSNKFWVRRASILSQIPQFRRGKGDMELFEKIVTPMFTEGKDWDAVERFFIRKAIGWTLRERVLKDPKSVVRFVKKYKKGMSGLTYREATRKLSKKMKDEC